MDDIVFHIAIGVKNDGLSIDAGRDSLAEILQRKIETTVLDVPWVTDMLVSKDEPTAPRSAYHNESRAERDHS
jgi:hypothetical protein